MVNSFLSFKRMYRDTLFYCASLCCASQMLRFYKLKAKRLRLTSLQWCGTEATVSLRCACTGSWNAHIRGTIELLHLTASLTGPSGVTPSPPLILETTDLASIPAVLSFLECHKNRILQEQPVRLDSFTQQNASEIHPCCKYQ